ncbi:MAG: hypothetical protein HYU36_17790 [Planctomycetes bacterium]|nr:hypothetical protein [Planctomycetota bacterium]
MDLAVDVLDSMVEGTLQASLELLPSPLATIQVGLESLLQKPGGCFEQASSSNYPNILALKYMQETGTVNPDLARRCRGLLERGYARLTSFRCKGEGYEWFGHDPGHEALTAYGLMQFHDVAEVFEVAEISVDLIAAVPCTYTAPASRAYLYYYNGDHKSWTAPVALAIARP